jgi:hypothetical protein
MSERGREILPWRRRAETISFKHQGAPGVNPSSYSATLGFYDDGRLGEIFMRAEKAGSELDVQARDISIGCSILLQHGCALDVISRVLTRNSDGSASGPLGALLDFLASGPNRGTA